MKNNDLSELRIGHLILDDLETDLKNRGDAPELRITTMPELNRKMWGLHKRKLTLIGARTSNGKSQMAINLAHDMATQGKRVFFLSLEMPRERILERMFCISEEVENVDLLKGEFNKDENIRVKFEGFKNKVKKMKIYISDCIGRDWDWMEQEVFPLFKEKPVDVVIIDHIQEIRGGQNQKQAMDNYIEKLRESAIRNNYALILCSQINRDSQSEKTNKTLEPKLHHLKGSGYLEESADIVILLHWAFHYSKEADDKVDPEEFIVHVAKNRDGMTGYIKMKYTPKFCRIRDYVEDYSKKEQIEQKDITESKINWEE